MFNKNRLSALTTGLEKGFSTAFWAACFRGDNTMHVLAGWVFPLRRVNLDKTPLRRTAPSMLRLPASKVPGSPQGWSSSTCGQVTEIE